MKIVIQRVSRAGVSVDGKIVSEIGEGMLVFLAIERGDTEEIFPRIIDKLVNLRIFSDADRKMNRSIKDAGGEFLVISQFTLAGSLKKGRRPSFDKAEEPGKAEGMYDKFCSLLEKQGVNIKKGVFAAMMDIELVNDGPVTFILDSRDFGF